MSRNIQLKERKTDSDYWNASLSRRAGTIWRWSQSVTVNVWPWEMKDLLICLYITKSGTISRNGGFVSGCCC